MAIYTRFVRRRIAGLVNDYVTRQRNYADNSQNERSDNIDLFVEFPITLHVIAAQYYAINLLSLFVYLYRDKLIMKSQCLVIGCRFSRRKKQNKPVKGDKSRLIVQIQINMVQQLIFMLNVKLTVQSEHAIRYSQNAQFVEFLNDKMYLKMDNRTLLNSGKNAVSAVGLFF